MLPLFQVNSTVPIASEVYKKHGVYNPSKYDYKILPLPSMLFPMFPDFISAHLNFGTSLVLTDRPNEFMC